MILCGETQFYRSVDFKSLPIRVLVDWELIKSKAALETKRWIQNAPWHCTQTLLFSISSVHCLTCWSCRHWSAAMQSTPIRPRRRNSLALRGPASSSVPKSEGYQWGHSTCTLDHSPKSTYICTFCVLFLCVLSWFLSALQLCYDILYMINNDWYFFTFIDGKLLIKETRNQRVHMGF